MSEAEAHQEPILPYITRYMIEDKIKQLPDGWLCDPITNCFYPPDYVFEDGLSIKQRGGYAVQFK